ncbi:MAG: rod shape-determining protein MreC [Patescibacteria group bacterium]|jgi:rod shape-determining protein MreC
MAPNREKKIYLSVGAVFLLIIALHYLGWLSAVEEKIRITGLPILGSINGISIKIGDNYQFFKNRDDFIAAYEKNISNREESEVLTADVKRFSEENAELRRQLNYFQTHTQTHLLANVVGKELISSDQSIIIDRGSNDGLSEGDPAIIGNGILIGKIFKVEKSISFIRLLNDNTSRVGSTILNHDKSLGVIEGGFGISLKMNLIPRDEIILVNDQVVTSGLEEKTPRGLLIGNIAEVENEPYKPFQQAVVTPATDYSKISSVSVLIIK